MYKRLHHDSDNMGMMYLDYEPDSDGLITVWFIYIKIEDSVPVLYAFTQYKDILEEFKKFRNMDIFYVKKKKFTETEYKDVFINNTKQNWNTYYLDRHEFYTYNENILSNRCKISFVCTGREEMDVILKSDDVYKILYDYSKRFNINNAAPEFKKVLEKIGYTCITSRTGYNSIDFWNNETENDYIEQNFDIDQFAVFVSNYGNTLKGIGKNIE